MFLLDTSVLSAVMGTRPVAAVASWLAGQPEDRLFTTTICQAEILAGIAVLPRGHKRQRLDAAAQAIFEEDFDGRILPFDGEAARFYADLFASSREAGRPVATADLMIAAIARTRGASLVTRNIHHFEGLGLPLVDPWAAA